MSNYELKFQRYTGKSYERPDAYDISRPAFSYNQEILDKIQLPRNPIILDLASGAGNESDYLEQKFKGAVIESDLSQNAFIRSYKRNYVLSDAEHQPFKDRNFDLVHSKDLLVHIYDKSLFFKEVERILKPKGQFILTTQVSSSGLIFFYFHLARKNQSTLISNKIFFQTPEEYTKLVKEAKLEYALAGTVSESVPFFYLAEKDLELISNNTGFSVINKTYWEPEPSETNWTKDPRVVYQFRKDKSNA